jgi:hypothetical protein
MFLSRSREPRQAPVDGLVDKMNRRVVFSSFDPRPPWSQVHRQGLGLFHSGDISSRSVGPDCNQGEPCPSCFRRHQLGQWTSLPWSTNWSISYFYDFQLVCSPCVNKRVCHEVHVIGFFQTRISGTGKWSETESVP